MFITCCIAVTCTFNAMVVDNDLLQLQSCIYSLLFIFVIIIILLYTALLIIFYKIPINISEYLHLYVQCGGECHRSNNIINSVYPLMLFFHYSQFVVFMVACWKSETSEFTSLASFILSSSPPSLPLSLSVLISLPLSTSFISSSAVVMVVSLSLSPGGSPTSSHSSS